MKLSANCSYKTSLRRSFVGLILIEILLIVLILFFLIFYRVPLKRILLITLNRTYEVGTQQSTQRFRFLKATEIQGTTQQSTPKFQFLNATEIQKSAQQPTQSSQFINATKVQRKNILEEGFSRVDANGTLIVFAAYLDYRYQNLIRFVSAARGDYHNLSLDIYCSLGESIPVGENEHDFINNSMIEMSNPITANFTTWNRELWR